MKLIQNIQDALLSRRLFFIAAFIKVSPYLLAASSATYAAITWDESRPVNFTLQTALAIVTSIFWALKLYEAYSDMRQ